MVVGGGTGGCATAAKFARDFNDPRSLIVIEPSEKHYYQPMFTLVGGGIKQLSDSEKLTADVLPKKATWLKDSVVEFLPKENLVKTKNGKTIKYEYLLVAVGLIPHYEKVLIVFYYHNILRKPTYSNTF